MVLTPQSVLPQTAFDRVFGSGRADEDVRERARSSNQMFVRNQTHLAKYSPGAKGRVFTAQEALEAFGWKVLQHLVERRVAPIVEKGSEIGPTIRLRLEKMELTPAQLSKKINVPEHEITSAIAGKKSSAIHTLTKIFQALALDDSRMGMTSNGGGDVELAVRFRDLHKGRSGVSPSVVLGLAEAAWVIATQTRLEILLDRSRKNIPKILGFEPISVSKQHNVPPWRDGMILAEKTRVLLGLQQNEPLKGLKEIVEKRLGIPVVQVSLPGHFAGATIANDGSRGIAVNIEGRNGSVWVRRMTIAHELGHLLWDPDSDLQKLRVDEYDILESDSRQLSDSVEMRANAFAAELLAPQAAVIKIYNDEGRDDNAVSQVMRTFGVGYSCASWQIYNGLGRTVDKQTIRHAPGTVPSDEWNAQETLTGDYFVLRETSVARTGRFAELCLRARMKNLISSDTAADFLSTTNERFLAYEPALQSLFKL